MKFKLILFYGLMCGLLAITACGGGGGSVSAPQPTTVTFRLSTSGTLPHGTSLAGIAIVVILPAGVTVETNADGSVSGVVARVTGVAAPGTVLTPLYTPASSAAPGKLAIALASNNAAGFATGEFAMITCNISSGISPNVADFVLTDFKPFDLNGTTVNGLTASATMI
jgi:hypothetical protein